MNAKVQVGGESLFEQNAAINSGTVFLRAVTMYNPLGVSYSNHYLRNNALDLVVQRRLSKAYPYFLLFCLFVHIEAG